MKRIFTTINEFNSSQRIENIMNKRLDNIFDTVEEYKQEGIQIEVKDVDIDSWRKFNEEYLLDIEEFIKNVNSENRILLCDFPSFIVTSFDEMGDEMDLGEIEMYELPIRIEYSYTHVYHPFKPKNFQYEAVDKFKVTYKQSTDELSSRDILELIETGVHHSEHGIIAFAINPDTGKYDSEISEEYIKQYVKENFGG